MLSLTVLQANELSLPSAIRNLIGLFVALATLSARGKLMENAQNRLLLTQDTTQDSTTIVLFFFWKVRVLYAYLAWD